MADGDITIITTIHPAKNGRRPITVAAAAEGELPTLLNGAFPDRHALADQAFGAVLKIQAAATAKASKKKASGKKAAKLKTRRSTPRIAKADQIGPEETEQGTRSPLTEVPADLPVIEGDEQPQLELEGIDG